MGEVLDDVVVEEFIMDKLFLGGKGAVPDDLVGVPA